MISLAMVDKSSLRKAGSQIKAVIRDLWRQISEAQLLMVSSSLAYTTILSIIPLLAVSFSIFQAFGGLEKLYGIIEPIILRNLAEGVDEQALARLRQIVGNIQGGALGATGLVALILTSMALLNSAEKAINSVWHATKKRSLFEKVASYWLFITLGPLAAAFIIGAATSSSMPLSRLVPGQAVIFLITIGLFFSIYKWVPNRNVHWIPTLISAFITSVLWNLARVGYALYTETVVNYDRIYGSLSAIPIFILWIYIAWIIVLGGAALTAVLQKRFDFEEESTAPVR